MGDSKSGRKGGGKRTVRSSPATSSKRSGKAPTRGTGKRSHGSGSSDGKGAGRNPTGERPRGKQRAAKSTGAKGRAAGSEGRRGKPPSKRSGTKSGGSKTGGDRTGDTQSTRSRKTQDGGERSGRRPAHRRDLRGAAAELPGWVVEDLARVTPDRQVAPALEALGEASDAFATGSYHKAFKKAGLAKELAPRDATIRETLGLAAYRIGNWKVALAELRTYRRLAGETTHMPVEMDVLRALGRPEAVEQAWSELQRLGGKPAVMKEGAVVYASHLVDRGDLDEAWDVVKPGRLTHDPFDEDLRMWYVAARVAALRGQIDMAGRLRNAILEHDPSFPGIDELETLIARSGNR